MRRLWPFLAAHRGAVSAAFGAALLGAGAFTALTPLVQRDVLDQAILGPHRDRLPWLLGILMALGVGRFACSYTRRWVGGRVSLAVQYDLRNTIYDQLQRLDFARHDELATGQLVSRANSDVTLIQALLAILPVMTGNLVQFAISLAIMFWLSPLLTLVALLVLPALLFGAVRMRSSVFPSAWDAQQQAGEVAGVVDEAVTGVRVVKAFGQEERELHRLVAAAERLFASRMRAVRIQARFQAGLQAVPALGQVGVLAFGGWLAIHHHLSLGSFLAFATYLTQLVAPVRFLAIMLTLGQQARAGAERILELLDSVPTVVEAPDAVELPALAGDVVLDDVSFGYLRSEPVLAGFSLHVRPGETVALVGASGSGKSTVALLLPRFYDIQGGSVRIDGIDVRGVKLDSLRRQIGVVFEESFLFSDTVRANIAYGRPDATDADVRRAAEAAEADDFIAALPAGYETVVGERGLTLSGGQRQRVALARALLTDPRILVLDDATSSVDARIEEEIHATLRRVMRGRTTVLVAHRRSTLRLADRIVVVEAGRVLDEGTHTELVERCARYRQLLSGAGESAEGADDDGPRTPTSVPGAGDSSEDGDRRAFTPEAWLAPDEDTMPAAWAADGGAGGMAAGVAGGVAGAVRPGGLGGGGAIGMGRMLPGGGLGPGLGPGGAMLGGLAPTPELLAAIGRLAPATERPAVDLDRALAQEPGLSLRRFLGPYRRPLLIGLVLVVLDSLATLAGPELVRHGIDAGVTQASTGALLVASLLLGLVALADWWDTWVEGWYTGRTGERLLFALRVRIFAHLQRLGLDFYDREMAGRIMTRMTSDVEALSSLLQDGLVNALSSLVICGGVIVLLLLTNVELTAVTLLIVPPLVAATLAFRSRSNRAYLEARDRIAAVNANLQESLSGVREAQAFAREQRNMREFRDVAGEHLDARLRAQRLQALYFPFVEFLSVAATALVLGVGASLVSRRALTPGELIQFLLLLTQFFAPIQQLSQVFDAYQQARAAVVKIGELLETPVSTPQPAVPLHPRRLRGHIQFQNVRFRYRGAAFDALQGVDLEIRPGETVALVGETGAGKSTIVKLVARFYDPTEGRVLIDGVALTDIDLNRFRRRLGYVPQEPFLFSGTIRDNIAYGQPTASPSAVEAAARAVGAHPFIASLPGGYLHGVAERGRSLSAGQRQLIALARARLVDPAILLLDEATSNLDLATEAQVNRAMGVVAAGRTTVLIAHRLPTAQRADRIIVVADGRVVQSGAPDALLAAAGPYADMWAAFSGSDDDAAQAAS